MVDDVCGGQYTSFDDLWSEIEVELYGAYRYLFTTHLETPREALFGVFRKSELNAGLDILDVISRRSVSKGNDNLEYYRDEGRSILP